MNQAQRDKLAATLEISPEERAVLDTNHPYLCRCDVCRRWWKLMGPENAEDAGMPNYEPRYGPFSAREILGEQ